MQAREERRLSDADRSARGGEEGGSLCTESGRTGIRTARRHRPGDLYDLVGHDLAGIALQSDLVRP